MSLHYDLIGDSISVRIDFEQMSGRNKSELLRKLIEESGVLGKLLANKEAADLVDEAMQNLWKQDEAK